MNDRQAKLQFRLLTFSLCAILIAPLAIYFLNKWGFHIPDGKGEPLSFWLIWELLSIVVTAVVTIIFWIMVFFGKGKGETTATGEAALDGAKGIQGFFATLALALFLIGFVGAGLTAYSKGHLPLQLLYLLTGVLGTVGLEIIILFGIHHRLGVEHQNFKKFRHKTHRHTCAKTVQSKVGERDNFIKYLCFSDIPIAIAFGVLTAFVGSYSVFEVSYSDNEMRGFIAGAVAMQLLYSNLVFWVESFAQTDGGYGLLGRLPRALQPIREMLRPEEDWSADDSIAWAERKLEMIFGGVNGSVDQNN